MNLNIYVLLFLLALLSCNKHIIKLDKELYGLNNYYREFDFSDLSQLNDLPSFGEDPSHIENEQLKSPIKAGEHKGLGRKFWFKNHGGEPNEAEVEFTIWLAANFQKNGAVNQAGKFSGFEGIYDRSAGWGGKKVTTQNSWSVRIAHGCENNEGKIPIGLYVYHPGMQGEYGTTVLTDFSLNKEQTYTFKLYIKMNKIGENNGVLSFHIDGNEIYTSNLWRFRNDSSVHIQSVWLDTYIGGTTPSKFDTYIMMDNLKIKW